MNKKIFLAGLMLAAMSMNVSAQKKDGGISQQMLQQIKGSQSKGAADKAIFNAIAANNINDLAKNFANAGEFDTHFSVETKAQSIMNQKQSGRCWMFSGFNVIRGNFAHESDSLKVELSQDYLFFYDQLEKANLFLQGVIDCAGKPMDDTRVQFFFKNPINDGGTFCGVADLTEKYGVVPTSVMPETYSAENTSKMAALVSSKLREYGLKLRKMVAEKKSKQAIQTEKTNMLGTIYHMLKLTLGEPVTEFTFAFKDKNGKALEAKKYTPKSFFKELTGKETLNGTFIMVMNDPRREYYKTYEVDFDRHTYDGHNWKYLNLPMDDIAQLAIASIKGGSKMYSSYDVGKQLDRKRGYLDTENFDYGSLFGITFGMDKAQRIETFDSGSTHAMTLTAVDLDKDGKKMYSSYDVGKFLDGKRGYSDINNFDYGSLFSTTFPMNKADRIATFDSGSTHAMTLVAVDLDAQGKPTKWKVENSWGPEWGHKGCLIMTNEWFNEYMFRLVVDRKYASEKILKLADQKPIMVMPEDPLFGADN